ncbi:epoxide hydrolase family protein [Microbacterium lushaniae]|uniref:Epoxide hydrolase 1 n=1 Tax=Microbacterium lushaniae TaxID=2614639 RepID=A0A5J6L6P3_9MICO|nr:epoxide hydrolase family protein [Microbacterium lushaniae]QEW04183.1 epoxide hydrolase 1 [Microbacterium lushaniae]
MEDHRVTPFRIRIHPDEVTDLRRRLDAARFPPELPGDEWSTGVPVAVLRDHVARWREHDWVATEERLNRLPQFTTEIDGQTVHFVHARSAVRGAVPLMLIHGWPGSFLEFEGLVGPLTDPAAHGGDSRDAFDVVIPSLPGFGFSTPLTGSGWSTRRIAAAFAELMTRLGYERFVVQGGDIGAAVAPEIGRVAPDRVIGVHVNGALGAFHPHVGEDALAAMPPVERDRMRRIGEFMQTELGYVAIQSTRPGLIGAMTADSPAGQLAWMLDKLQSWSHPPEQPATEVLGDEFVFADLSLYWFTASGGSSAYVGYAQGEGWGDDPVASGVPTAAIQFAHDIGIRAFAQECNRIVRWSEHSDRGGHFAALEEPELLVDDVRAFVRSLRPADGDEPHPGR